MVKQRGGHSGLYCGGLMVWKVDSLNVVDDHEYVRCIIYCIYRAIDSFGDYFLTLWTCLYVMVDGKLKLVIKDGDRECGRPLSNERFLEIK